MNEMKNLKLYLSIAAIAVAMLVNYGCSEEFLDYNPKGVVASADLNSVENVEKMVIAAYASLGNDHFWAPYGNLFPYGDIASDDSYKGGGGNGDVIDYDFVERFTGMPTTLFYVNRLWLHTYQAISRTNDALKRINELTDAEYPQKAQRIAEMRFVRGFHEFNLKKVYRRIVFVDENDPREDIVKISNVALSNDEGWQRIAEEFRAGVAALPDVQAEEGRPTRNSARAYLAKTLLFKAYVQDDAHQVVSITASELNEVVSLIDQIEATGEYDLFPDISDNYLLATESGIESVWAIMRSFADGSPEGRSEFSNMFNYTWGPGGCCWFNLPSQNLAQAFKTDANGLPIFDTFDDPPILSVVGDLMTNNVDPRISHTMVFLGQPFKYEPEHTWSDGWLRAPGVYGTIGPSKMIAPQSERLPIGPLFTWARNTDQIRYADVLLWQAEALIELGRQDEALPIINRIRARAATSTARLVFADGSPVGNWVIGPYTTMGDQANARKILRKERRLELAMEAHRFFDLVRWGIAGPTLNAYFASEGQRREYLQTANFAVGQNEYFPIAQSQIVISEGLYEQNPGYR